MSILIRVGITALALMAASYLVPGITIANIYVALLAAVVLGVLNLLVRPILLVLTLPITLLTLGLSIFVLNALLFWGVSAFVDGFTVGGFLPAFVGSLVVSILSTIGNKLLT